MADCLKADTLRTAQQIVDTMETLRAKDEFGALPILARTFRTLSNIYLKEYGKELAVDDFGKVVVVD